MTPEECARRVKYQAGYDSRKARGLVLVVARARLSLAQLAYFTEPRTWAEILTLEPWRTEAWWRTAIIDADEYGRGLLTWLPEAKGWRLSARGREVVRLRSEGATCEHP